MKKKSIILFAMIIAIVTIFAVVFTACNGLKGIVDGLNKETYTDQTKSLSEVEEALGSKYYIKYKITSTDTDGTTETEYYVTASDGTYYFYDTETSDLFLKQVGTKYYAYSKTNESTNYNSVAVYNHEVNPFAGLTSYLVMPGEEITYTSKSSDTFLSRACTKYECDLGVATFAGAASYTEHYYIDNATGVVLKHDISASATTVDGTDNASVSWEVTEFKFGDDVNAFMQTEKNKIVVSEWDQEFFVSVGLTTVQTPGANASFVAAEKDGNEYEITYTVTSATAVNAIINSFFSSGANRDKDSGEEKSSYTDSDIYSATEDVSISFNVYTSTDEDELSIYAYNTSEDWLVEITARKHTTEA